MKSSNKWLNEASQLCAELGPEDGIDPRYLSYHQGRGLDHQKSLRLCSEVIKIVSLVITGEMGNPILQSIQIVDVVAEGNGQFLRIVVGHHSCNLETSESEVLNALTHIQGYLRSTIAQCINRKRVPALKFQYVGLLELMETEEIEVNHDAY